MSTSTAIDREAVNAIPNGIPISFETASGSNFDLLKKYPAADDFIAGVREEESKTTNEHIVNRHMAMTQDGVLTLKGQSYLHSTEVAQVLASIAGIPGHFFTSLDPDLRAHLFNRLLPKKAEESLTVTIRNGNEVSQIQHGRLVRPSRADVLEEILNQAPSDVIRNDIRVIKYAFNGHVDLSLVTANRLAEPRKGDISCGGTHLIMEASGAIQVGPAMFRLRCLNGAMGRVCLGGSGQHRVRRGDGKDSLRNTLASVREFANTAWMGWEGVVQGLKLLADQPFEQDNWEELVKRLRGSPFFISAEAAKLVKAALLRDGESDLTMYDLYNAITEVGTHDRDLPERYRYRLRLGGGALTTNPTEICDACKQFKITMKKRDSKATKLIQTAASA